MVRRNAQWVLAVAAVVGVAVSSFLLVEYALPEALSTCGPGGGCMNVRNCRSALVLHGSWPAIGVLAFGVLLGMALSPRPDVRRWLPLVGTGAGLVGAALIVIQRTQCGALCKYCLVADIAGLVACGAAWVERGAALGDAGGDPLGIEGRHRRALGGIAAASLVAVFAWGLSRPPMPAAPAPRVMASLPAPIQREQREGVTTVVEFADFQCPFCRRFHSDLAPVVASYGSRVRFVRKHFPMSFHEHAMDAARAACCADEQGRNDAMADALFRAEDLSPQGCESLAVSLGMDREAFRACVSAPRTAERIARDRHDAEESQVDGIPATFIGSERIDGAVPAATLRASIERALQRTASPPRPQG